MQNKSSSRTYLFCLDILLANITTYNLLTLTRIRGAQASQVTQWERIHLQCKRHKRYGFSTSVRKIPWRRKWQPTSIFLPGKSNGQRSLKGYSLWGHKRVGQDLGILQQHFERKNIGRTMYVILFFFFFFFQFLNNFKFTKRKRKKKKNMTRLLLNLLGKNCQYNAPPSSNILDFLLSTKRGISYVIITQPSDWFFSDAFS